MEFERDSLTSSLTTSRLPSILNLWMLGFSIEKCAVPVRLGFRLMMLIRSGSSSESVRFKAALNLLRMPDMHLSGENSPDDLALSEVVLCGRSPSSAVPTIPFP